MNFVKRGLSLFLLAVLALAMLAGCGNNRDYQPDVTLQLAGNYGTLIIREWTDDETNTNGAEVYCDDGKKVLLGETSGTSDGSFPFTKGDFTFEQEGKKIVLRWNGGEGNWKSKTFMVP